MAKLLKNLSGAATVKQIEKVMNENGINARGYADIAMDVPSNNDTDKVKFRIWNAFLQSREVTMGTDEENAEFAENFIWGRAGDTEPVETQEIIEDMRNAFVEHLEQMVKHYTIRNSSTVVETCNEIIEAINLARKPKE